MHYMNRHILEHFSEFSDETPRGNFHRVIFLNEEKEFPWSAFEKLVPSLEKGWFELSRLNADVRLQFVNDFWLSKLPFRVGIPDAINHFFSTLDDIHVVLWQRTVDDPFEAELIYSLKESGGFYRGGIGASKEQLESLQKLFQDVILPEDYLAFLKIHDGFSKATDSTGILRSSLIYPFYQKFQKELERREITRTAQGKSVDPKSLIPFYESFGMPYYQCFWNEWHPKNQMGNIYFSFELPTIAVSKDGLGDEETLSFATFLEWLRFYLEPVI